MRALGIAILVGAALLCGAVPADAQMELGVIKGRVVDEAGKPIQGVAIRLVNVGRGREVTITTDKDGRFYRRGLQVGGYELKVEHQGYQPVSNKIKIAGGTDSNFDFSLAKAAAGGSKEFQEGVAAFNAKDFARRRREVRGGNRPVADGGAAARQPGAGLLPVEAAGRGRRQPGEGGARWPPTTPPIQFQLGSAYVDTQAYDKAVAALREGPDAARRTWPRIRWRPKPPRRSARSISRRARFPKPRPSSRRCSPPRPGNAGATLGMAKVHFSKGDAAKALELFEQVVAAHPGTPEAAQAETFIKELKKG